MFRPAYLKEGDKVALVSPAGAIDVRYIDEAVELLSSWGLVPLVGKHAATRSGYFAGTDEQRASDMQWALNNDEVRAIFCTRGGYGSVRIVERLDYSHFQGSPSWLVGLSDITVFHAKLNTLGIQSLHATMPSSFLTMAPDAMQRMKEFLFGKISSYTLPCHNLNRNGYVEAELVGGNLTLLHCLRSTELEWKFQTPILFIEDVGEELYSIDRMMHSFKLSYRLERVQGMIVGDFTKMRGEHFGKTAYEIIREAVDDYQFPVCFGFPAGHSDVNYPLIMGANITLDIDNGGVVIDIND